MSRSSALDTSPEGLDGYVAGWRAIFRLLRQGRSWSGRERNCAFYNLGGDGGGAGDGVRFADVSALTGLDFPDDGRALAVVDWDGDGDLDVWLHNRTGPRLRLMRNRLDELTAGHRSLVLRLRGTRSNRDAVGARATVEVAGGRRLSETVTAGDGYLSQSTKALHFGLGRADRAGVTVRWPDGRREAFGEVAAGRYLLVEGSGRAAALEPRPPLELAAAPQTPPTSAAGRRVFLPMRVPLPELPYAELAGGARRTVVAGGRPLLLNLWASWCLPCRGELAELAERRRELEAAGVGVLALTVDGLDPAQGTDAGDARRFLQDLDFSYPAGIATPELLEKIELLEEMVYDRQRPLGVPMSFLLSADGRLAALYRGRVELDAVLADARALDGSAEELQLRASALPGRWHARLPELDLAAMAQGFRPRYPEDAERYLTAALERQSELLARQDLSAEVRRELAARQADARLGLAEEAARQGRVEEAVAHLRGVLELDPEARDARHRLAELLRAAGRRGEAVTEYRRLLAGDAGDAGAHYGLGAALMEGGDVETAFGHLQEAARLDPASPAPLHSMAWALLLYADREGGGAVRDAVRFAERGVELSERRDPRLLDVLAAAYAEAGRLDAAEAAAAEALKLARAEGDAVLQTEIGERLAAYRRARGTGGAS